MRMGNFMRGHHIDRTVMAARSTRAGIRHLTVVPANFEPGPDHDPDAEDTDSNGETPSR